MHCKKAVRRVIAGALAEARSFASEENIQELKRLVSIAERSAATEIPGFDPKEGGDDFDAVMKEIYPFLVSH